MRRKEDERGGGETRPYVIRHSRPKTLAVKNTPRRLRFPGRAIKDQRPGAITSGLDIEGEFLLPFLLAARVTALRPDVRPALAEGLSSSYEAFLHTRNDLKRISKKFQMLVQ